VQELLVYKSMFSIVTVGYVIPNTSSLSCSGSVQ